MRDQLPTVSLGVPVYNGERFLAAALDSLLAQTYPQTQIIISDNGSTDRTEAISRDYLARDRRVCYFRAGRNLGPARNFNRCVDLATGSYFKWCAADDVCAPEFVERCVAALERNPRAVLAYPRTKIIDADGNVVRANDYEVDYTSPSPQTRLRNLLCVNHRQHGAYEIFGVIRTGALKATGLFASHVRADSVLLARLCLEGEFLRSDQYLFYNRDHDHRSVALGTAERIRPGSKLVHYVGYGPLPPAQWWNAGNETGIVFPEWRVVREYWRAVADSALPYPQKRSCYPALAYTTLRYLPKLARDVLIGTEQVIRRTTQKRGLT